MLSIVTTSFNSSSYIKEFVKRILITIEKLNISEFEIIIVDDGSTDNSVEVINDLKFNQTRIKLYELSKNFGHHNAIWAGLTVANGEKIFLIDIDLEEPPELLYDFHFKLNENDNCDVVYGVQKNRKGFFISKKLSLYFFYIFNLLCGFEIPKNSCTVRLMKREFLNAALEVNEFQIVINAIFFNLGFNQIPIEFSKGWKRKTTYSFVKRYRLFVNAITAYSIVPLLIISYFGFFVMFCSIILITSLIIKYFSGDGDVLSGWTSLIASVWFLGGLIIFCIGILGSYIGKTHQQAKGNSRFIFKKNR